MRKASLRASSEGQTFVEMILAAAVVGLVVLFIARYYSSITLFFRRTAAQQSANLDVRRSIDTIAHALGNARAETIQISTPSDPQAPPNSRIDFVTEDGSTNTITWSNMPPNSVHVLKTPPGKPTIDSVVAQHARSLMFTGDYRDLSTVNVTLNIDVPFDMSGATGHAVSVLIANQTVRTVSRR